jgi:hypothetical protein
MQSSFGIEHTEGATQRWRGETSPYQGRWFGLARTRLNAPEEGARTRSGLRISGVGFVAQLLFCRCLFGGHRDGGRVAVGIPYYRFNDVFDMACAEVEMGLVLPPRYRPRCRIAPETLRNALGTHG